MVLSDCVFQVLFQFKDFIFTIINRNNQLTVFDGSPRGIVDCDINVEGTILIGLVQACMYLIIEHIDIGFGIERHIPLDTTQAPEILTLKIGTVGEAVHLHSQPISARFHVWREVEFRIGLGIFGIADKLPINPKEIGRFHRSEVDIHFTVSP